VREANSVVTSEEPELVDEPELERLRGFGGPNGPPSMRRNLSTGVEWSSTGAESTGVESSIVSDLADQTIPMGGKVRE
jgi:hypothetical protein